MSRVIIISSLFLLAAERSPGAVTIQFQEVGSSVVATISGSIVSLEGLSAPSDDGGFAAGSAVNSSRARVLMGSDVDGFVGNVYFGASFSGQWISIPSDFGSTTGGSTSASSSSINYPIWVTKSGISLTKSYSLGEEFIGIATWDAHSFNTLGLAEGTYTYSWTGDTIDIVVGVAPIPEPSTYGLILGGLALAGAALRRRKLKR